ncbi:MAG: 50S ribosomal protein L11 methyltransferase [Bryobacteraceae bacterium]
MFSIEIETSPEEKDLLVAELWEEGCSGISELDDGHLRVFFEDQDRRESLIQTFRAASWREEVQQDWVAMSRAGWEPLSVGERFFLVPEWRDDPAPPGRFRIVVNPGMAFGTGIHETTRLCLEALESYVRPASPLLDVGTGSGILARAGALLGAAPVWACDVDPIAVEIARSNLEAAVFVGSIDAVRPGSAAVTVANISPEAIAALAPALLDSLRPGGIALVSGFEKGEVASVRQAVEQIGGQIQDTRYKGNWALLSVTKPTG